MTDTLFKLQRNWEGLATEDPLWAILTDPHRAGKKWTPEEFFATGEREIEKVVECLAGVGVTIDSNGQALDFGCGVGRLTQAISKRTARCIGVDISATMILHAKSLNTMGDKCHFVLNGSPVLTSFGDQEMSFVYSSIVLQHITPTIAEGYIREFIRILKPHGVLVFHELDADKWPLMRRFSECLTRVRVAVGFRTLLRRALTARPPLASDAKSRESFRMEMHCIPEARVRDLIYRCGGQVVDVRLTNCAASDFNGDLKYLDREPAGGFVSKQYCVIKRV
jgi:ubiquinone/menaquinone biosynthesis C-methylase UbiE